MHILLPLLLILWSGMIIGLSFIATPVKFQAPHLSLPVGLEVGRVTFQIFHKIEWVMAILGIFAAWIFPHSGWLKVAVMAIAIVLLLQGFWLLPELAMRAEAVMQGTPLAKSYHHVFYVMAEGVKFLSLFVIGIWLLLKGNTYG